MKNPIHFMLILIFSLLVCIGLVPKAAPLFLLFSALPFWMFFHLTNRFFFSLICGASLGAVYLLAGKVNAIAFGSLVVLLSVFGECLRHKVAILWSGVLAVVSGSAVAAIFVGWWVRSENIRLGETIRSFLSAFSQELAHSGAKIVISEDVLFQQIPSGIIIFMTMILAIVLKIGQFSFHFVHRESPSERPLKALPRYEVPALFIWLTLISILGSVLLKNHQFLQAFALNSLNILGVLYFFLGVSIVGSFFSVFSVGYIWRGFWYFLLVFKFSLVLSLIGFSDYWVGYRGRLVKHLAKSDKTV